MPAVDEIVRSRPARCLRITGSTALLTFIGPKSSVDLVSDLFGTEFLEEAGIEVAGIVHQDVDPAEFGDGGCDRSMGVLEAGDIELDCQQVVVVANRSRDLDGLATGGDDRVTSGQRCLSNVEAQTTARTDHAPHSHPYPLPQCSSGYCSVRDPRYADLMLNSSRRTSAQMPIGHRSP